MVVCSECGTPIKHSIIRCNNRYVCNKCWVPQLMGCGNPLTSGHYEDDKSGGSGSWDSAVKICEQQGL